MQTPKRLDARLDSVPGRVSLRFIAKADDGHESMTALFVGIKAAGARAIHHRRARLGKACLNEMRNKRLPGAIEFLSAHAGLEVENVQKLMHGSEPSAVFGLH
ncbi:MAG: hypothetical protein AAF681_15980, partial [Pseudomonadota bacterium]